MATFTNRVYDLVEVGFVRWDTTGSVPDTGGASYPGPDAFGNTLDFVVEAVVTAAAGTTSPLTTKGDVYTYDTSDQRLGVGSDGEVLTADSAEGTGLKWAAGGVTPGGADTHVQYNDGGSLGGSAAFTFDKSATDPTLTVTGSATADIVVGDGTHSVDLRADGTNPRVQATSANDLLITNDGAGGVLVNGANPASHASGHENGGGDEISVAGLSGVLADDQNPVNHATDHQSGGGDAIKLDDLAAPDDNTDLDVSISAHGLTPKLSNVASEYLSGTGVYSVPLTPRQEALTSQVITASDDAITDTINNTPVSNASVSFYFNGILASQGAGKDYTVSGTTITWLASSGTAPDMDTSDVLDVVYES